MKRSGTADLPLHYGQVPKWLAQRMSRLGGAIVEALIIELNEWLAATPSPLLGC